MTILPPPDERLAAQIAMALDSLPRERAGEVIGRGAMQYFNGVHARGWSADEAGEMTAAFTRAIVRHWQAAAACRLQ